MGAALHLLHILLLLVHADSTPLPRPHPPLVQCWSWSAA